MPVDGLGAPARWRALALRSSDTLRFDPRLQRPPNLLGDRDAIAPLDLLKRLEQIGIDPKRRLPQRCHVQQYITHAIWSSRLGLITVWAVVVPDRAWSERT